MLSSAELNFSCVVVALLSCLSLASANSTRTASCTHYWQTESGPLLSGKVVGVDIGQSSYNDGYYDCMISLSVNDLKNENILYIGEVGDSAYVEFDNVLKIFAFYSPS
jgi:hypothetical protein